MPKPLKRILIATVSLVVFFAALELVLRAVGFFYPPIEPIQIWNRVEDQAMRLGISMHAEAPLQLWAPEPGAEIPWGRDEKINPDGFRGPLMVEQKRPGVLRIATLGDSSTFGYDVGYADTYSGQLQVQLEQRGIPCEVLNAGVVGFTVRQGLERYRELVRPFRPDVVIAAFGAVNDSLDALQSIPDKEKIALQVRLGGFWTQVRISVRKELRTAHLIAKLADSSRAENSRERDRIFQKELLEDRMRRSSGQVDWPGRRRVPLDDFAACLEELAAAVRQDGARLILLSMPRKPVAEAEMPILTEYSKTLVETGARLGVPVVDGRSAFARSVGQGQRVGDLFVDHYHPSPNGHRVLAAALAKELEANPPPPAR